MGDICHCIRSALDHVSSQIMREHTGKSQRVPFPTHQMRQNLVDAATKSPINGIIPRFAEIILNDIRPCEAGDYDLWAAGKLNNFDKHEEIPIVAGISRISIDGIYAPKSNISIRGPFTLLVRGGAVTSPFSFPSPFIIEGQPIAIFQVSFGEIQSLQGLKRKPVLPFVLSAYKSAVNAVDAIEAEYLK